MLKIKTFNVQFVTTKGYIYISVYIMCKQIWYDAYFV